MRNNRHVFDYRHSLIFLRKNNFSHSRFAFSIPKRTGKAHYRNRIKRTLREHLRLNLLPMRIAIDFLIVIKSKPECKARLLADINDFIARVKNDRTFKYC